MTPVHWGIIGIGRHFLTRVLPALRVSDTDTIIAVASRNIDKARATASDLGIPCAYGSYDDLLADRTVEAVYISASRTTCTCNG